MYKAVKYNPSIHHRRSIRLKGYDYSRPGIYFITICCQNRELRFGKIENQIMVLNQFGIIAQNEWYKLPERFQNLQLGAFQVMPNHIHAIIILHENNPGATLVVAPNAVAPMDHDNVVAPDNTVAPMNDNTIGAGASPATIGTGASPAPMVAHTATTFSNPTVGNIVGAYKSLVANECLKICKSKNEKMGKLWQRNYYERIIRDDRAFIAISKYILNNPAKWNGNKSL